MEEILKNIKEMLKDRGEEIKLYEEKEKEYEKKDYYSKSNKIKYPYLLTDKTCVIICVINEYKKILFEEIKSKSEKMEDLVTEFIKNHEERKNYVIVLSGEKKLASNDKNVVTQFDKQLQKMGGIFQEFYDYNFKFNPTKHELVPKHRKLESEEVKEIMTKYMLRTKTQMPFILKTDIIAKWLGLKVGDVVEITHYNENSGISYYYRCCV